LKALSLGVLFRTNGIRLDEEAYMQLQDHSVLVTGGSDGIGFALAQAFRERGNRVTICGRRAERLATAQAKLGGNGDGVHTVTADVSDENDLRQLVNEAVQQMGGLSILVNNAGVQFQDRYGEMDPDAILEHVDVEVGTNLTAVVKLTALCLPHLAKQASAAIVNISSILALAPKQSAPVYCATKAAVRFFTKSLRYQLDERMPNVLVFDALPPLVNTAMTTGRGHKGIKPAKVAAEILRSMEIDRLEIPVGKTKTVKRVQRVFPGLVERVARRR
jgi:uncharacterized oxidoreductase